MHCNIAKTLDIRPIRFQSCLILASCYAYFSHFFWLSSFLLLSFTICVCKSLHPFVFSLFLVQDVKMSIAPKTLHPRDGAAQRYREAAVQRKKNIDSEQQLSSKNPLRCQKLSGSIKQIQTACSCGCGAEKMLRFSQGGGLVE